MQSNHTHRHILKLRYTVIFVKLSSTFEDQLKLSIVSTFWWNTSLLEYIENSIFLQKLVFFEKWG